jgi:5-dehydro-4-deoxyglucarate dehydratase
MRLDGLLAFPLTPFTADDEVDQPAFGDHLESVLAQAPAGVFVACGTGEFSALSVLEWQSVLRTATSVVDGRVPVFAGVGGGPRLAREGLALAAEAGCDGVLLMPPYLVTAPPAGVLRHIAYVTEASSLPVVVYQRDNARLDPDTATALLDLPAVIGLKDGVGDVDMMLREVTAVRTSGHQRAETFNFLNGLPTAELSVQAYEAIGVPSYSSAVLNFVPEVATAFFRAYRGGDHTTVQRLLAAFFLPFAALRAQVPGYAVSLIKAGSIITGTDLGGVRPPLIDPTHEHVEQLAQIIAAGRAALPETAVTPSH